MDSNDKLILDIKNLIKFYDGLGETNNQIENYLNKLHLELERLTNEQNNQE